MESRRCFSGQIFGTRGAASRLGRRTMPKRVDAVEKGGLERDDLHVYAEEPTLPHIPRLRGRAKYRKIVFMQVPEYYTSLCLSTASVGFRTEWGRRGRATGLPPLPGSR